MPNSRMGQSEGLNQVSPRKKKKEDFKKPSKHRDSSEIAAEYSCDDEDNPPISRDSNGQYHEDEADQRSSESEFETTEDEDMSKESSKLNTQSHPEAFPETIEQFTGNRTSRDQYLTKQNVFLFLLSILLISIYQNQSTFISEQSLKLAGIQSELERSLQHLQSIENLILSQAREIQLLKADKDLRMAEFEELSKRMGALESNLTDLQTQFNANINELGSSEDSKSIWGSSWNILSGNGDSQVKEEGSPRVKMGAQAFQWSISALRKSDFPNQMKETWIQISSQVIPSLDSGSSRPSVLAILKPPQVTSAFARCFASKLSFVINQAHSSPSPSMIINGPEWFRKSGSISGSHQALKTYLESKGKSIIIEKVEEIQSEDHLMVFHAFCDNVASIDPEASFIFILEIPQDDYAEEEWTHWNGKEIAMKFLTKSWTSVLNPDKLYALISRVTSAPILLVGGDDCY